MGETTDLRLRCADADATRRVGATVGRAATAGTVVLLEGQLGAGKTVFAQGVGAGLDVPSIVNSPTFVLMNEHLGGRLPLRHADLYRLDDPESIAELGLAEAAVDGVLLIEWPERGHDMLPTDHLLVRLTPLSDEIGDAVPRELTISASGPSGTRALNAIRAAALVR